MNSLNILFLGSKKPYSQKVRTSLKESGHQLYKVDKRGQLKPTNLNLPIKSNQ